MVGGAVGGEDGRNNLITYIKMKIIRITNNPRNTFLLMVGFLERLGSIDKFTINSTTTGTIICIGTTIRYLNSSGRTFSVF